MRVGLWLMVEWICIGPASWRKSSGQVYRWFGGSLTYMQEGGRAGRWMEIRQTSVRWALTQVGVRQAGYRQIKILT